MKGRDLDCVPWVYAQREVIGVKKGAGPQSWILVDSSGEEVMLDVDKHAIMHRLQIHARDFRILDPFLSYPSAILGRENAIILNLEYVKAIITAQEVLLRDPLDENIVCIVKKLQTRLKALNMNRRENVDDNNLTWNHDVETSEADDFPFEFCTLEIALESICIDLADRTKELEIAVYPALDMLTSKISISNLDRLRKLKSQMTRLTARVQKVRDELEHLLDNDDDMADLYLSRKLAGASPVSGSRAAGWSLASPAVGSNRSQASRVSVAAVRGEENDVEELEMLLEAYFVQSDGTLNRLTMLREYIYSTEDYINIQLDNHRNQLIQLELILSAGTLCITIYSLLAGIFGMNIPYTWNEGYGFMFKWVVIVSGMFSALLLVLIISYARYKGLVRL